MRLFRLEVKRIMKSRRTLTLLAAALLMSIVMAYLPISFESINRPGEDGKIIELDGLPAIQFKRDYYEKTAGNITPQKLAEALRTYQSYVKEYGTLNDVPLDIYIENIMAIRPMLGSFCTLGIRIFLRFVTSHQIGLVKPNENNGVTQTSERTLCSGD